MSAGGRSGLWALGVTLVPGRVGPCHVWGAWGRGGDSRGEKAEEERDVRCAPWALGLNPVATGLGIRPRSAVWVEVPGSSVRGELGQHVCMHL